MLKVKCSTSRLPDLVYRRCGHHPVGIFWLGSVQSMYQTVHYDGELQSQPSSVEVHAMTEDGDQTLHWKTKGLFLKEQIMRRKSWGSDHVACVHLPHHLKKIGKNAELHWLPGWVSMTSMWAVTMRYHLRVVPEGGREGLKWPDQSYKLTGLPAQPHRQPSNEKGNYWPLQLSWI